MSNDLRTAMIVDLKGNLERQAHRFGNAITKFSQRGKRQLRSLDRGFAKQGRVIAGLANRYTTLIGLGTAAAAASHVVNRDARLTQLQTDGRATEEQIKKLKAALFEIGNDPNIRLNPDVVLGGVEEIVTRTGDLDFALKNLRNIALTVRATASDSRDVGAVFSNMFKAGIHDAEKLQKLIDALVQQTYQGSVAFRDISRVGNKLFAPVIASSGTGQKTVLETGALAQIVIDAVGSPDEAAEAIKALYASLEKKDVQKILKTKAGITVKNSQGKIKLPSELLPEIYKAAKGDFGILGKLFGDTGVKVFQGLSLPGNIKKLEDLSNLKTNGDLLKTNSRINASTAKAAGQLIANKTDSVIDPIISKITKGMAKDISESGFFSLLYNRDSSLDRYQKISKLLGKNNEIKLITKDNKSALENNKDQKLHGEIKIIIDHKNGRTRVEHVRSNNKNIDIEVDNGTQMVNP